VSLSSMLDGVWRLDGHLDALDGEILDTALRLAAGSDDDTEAPRTPAQRRADALVNIAKRFLDHEEQPPARRNRPHVNVIVTRDDLEAGAASAPTAPCSTVPHWPLWCAIRPCTGW
jgi:hypothetical protein